MKSAIPLLIALSIVIISLQFAITAQAAPSEEDYDVTATAFQKWLQLNRGASPLSLLMAANDDYDVVAIDDSDSDNEDDDVNGSSQEQHEYSKGSLGFEHHPRYSRYERQRVTNDVMKRAKSDWLQAWTTNVAKRVPKGIPNCMRICLAQRYLHPSQCHSLC